MKFIVTQASGSNGTKIIWDSDTCSIVDYWSSIEIEDYLRSGNLLGNASIEYDLVCTKRLNNTIVYEKYKSCYKFGSTTVSFFKDICFVVEYNSDLYVLPLFLATDLSVHIPIVKDGILRLYKDVVYKCEFTKVPITKTALRKIIILQDSEYLRRLVLECSKNEENVRTEFEIGGKV